MPSTSYPFAWALLGAVHLVGASSATGQSAGQAPASLTNQRNALSLELDRLVGAAVSARAMPGASVAIMFSDGRMLSRSYGSASVEHPTGVTNSTRFRIGSISKLVTSLAILRLVEERKLDLDAPVSLLLPHWPEVARLPTSVTLRRLLNHTSGLPDFTRAELDAKVARGFTTDDDVSSVLQRPIRSEPGAEWAYADLPFRILSRVVERASGRPYGDYVAQTIAPALSLASLGLCEPGAAGHASGYISRNGALQPEPAYSIRGLLGEGGLCSTADDLARLPREVIRRRWISDSSLATMTAPTRLSGGQLVNYGLGVRGGWVGPVRSWGHTGGGLDGSWAAVAYFPERRLTIAVVANGTGSESDAVTLFGAIAAAVLANPALEDQPVDAGLAASISGAYRRRDVTTCITRGPAGMTRSRLGSSSTPTSLWHQGSARFARRDYPLDRIVFQTDGQPAIGYSVYYDGFFAEYWNRTTDGACRAAP
jgi:CubicO group peptidase (beta-lactamase class C family)